MSIRVFILLLLTVLPIKPLFSMGKVLAVQPFFYPTQILEEIEESEEVLREPQAEVEKKPASFKSGKFKTPKGLETKVHFWTLVYAKHSNHEYLIHDRESMIVYEIVSVADIVNSGVRAYQKEKLIDQRLLDVEKKYQTILKSIHSKEGKNLSAKEEEVFEKFKNHHEENKFQAASSTFRIRAQLGQSDKFKKGIKYSGQYLGRLEEIFKKHRLPVELTRLVFVESMFNLNAHSHVGASGLWQFMKSTGRRFLKIGEAVDERRDPIKATEAAAKLLSLNYDTLKSWPLAVTAYNHGRMGVFRISKKLKTKSLVKIIDNYSSSTFGFASKNFYAEFLAALDVETNSEKYFGKLKIAKELKFDTVILPKYVPLAALVNYTKISQVVLLTLNPSLTKKVREGEKFIPKGFELRIPSGNKKLFLARFKTIPKRKFLSKQVRTRYHKIRRGDTLSYLAKRYKTTVSDLKEANNISNSRNIHVGQVLIIP